MSAAEAGREWAGRARGRNGSSARRLLRQRSRRPPSPPDRGRFRTGYPSGCPSGKSVERSSDSPPPARASVENRQLRGRARRGSFPWHRTRRGDTLLMLAFKSWPARVPGSATASLKAGAAHQASRSRACLTRCREWHALRDSQSLAARSRFCSGGVSANSVSMVKVTYVLAIESRGRRSPAGAAWTTSSARNRQNQRADCHLRHGQHSAQTRTPWIRRSLIFQGVV